MTGKEANDYASVHGQQAGQREPKKNDMLPASPDRLPHLVNPYDAKEDLTKRAKSWLHATDPADEMQGEAARAPWNWNENSPGDKMDWEGGHLYGRRRGPETR